MPRIRSDFVTYINSSQSQSNFLFRDLKDVSEPNQTGSNTSRATWQEVRAFVGAWRSHKSILFGYLPFFSPIHRSSTATISSLKREKKKEVMTNNRFELVGAFSLSHIKPRGFPSHLKHDPVNLLSCFVCFGFLTRFTTCTDSIHCCFCLMYTWFSPFVRRSFKCYRAWHLTGKSGVTKRSSVRKNTGKHL